MIEKIYSVMGYAALPFVMGKLLWRSRKAPAYRLRWAERLGTFPHTPRPGGVWIHAVSVGEVMAAIPVIQRLLDERPDLPLTITTMTPTGSDRVKALWGDRVFHVYLPYDLPHAVNRFLNQIKPALSLVVETELWPNLFKACSERKIPLFVINARLSAKSAAGYAKLQPLTRRLLKCVDLLVAQNMADAKRFLDLGLPVENIEILGNLKFDIKIPPKIVEQGKVLRETWGNTRPVLIAASTHPNEDEIILEAFSTAKQHINNLLLLLVPRHPERFTQVEQLCQSKGFKTVRRTTALGNETDMDIYLGDTMGELNMLFAASDIAIVAGSFAKVGGHNVLEAAALGIPTIVGPYTFNFAQITQDLKDCGGLIQNQNHNQLAPAVLELFTDSEKREHMGNAALEFVKKNQGALDHLWHIMTPYLPKRANTG